MLAAASAEPATDTDEVDDDDGGGSHTGPQRAAGSARTGCRAVCRRLLPDRRPHARQRDDRWRRRQRQVTVRRPRRRRPGADPADRQRDRAEPREEGVPHQARRCRARLQPRPFDRGGRRQPQLEPQGHGRPGPRRPRDRTRSRCRRLQAAERDRHHRRVRQHRGHRSADHVPQGQADSARAEGRAGRRAR